MDGVFIHGFQPMVVEIKAHPPRGFYKEPLYFLTVYNSINFLYLKSEFTKHTILGFPFLMGYTRRIPNVYPKENANKTIFLFVYSIVMPKI